MSEELADEWVEVFNAFRNENSTNEFSVTHIKPVFVWKSKKHGINKIMLNCETALPL